MAYDAGAAAVNRDTSFATRDRRVLHGRLFAPRDPVAVMVINPATGYPARFYHAFAEAAALSGWAVLTYDYRGQGASADRPVKDDPACMLDWALEDIPAAARHICQLYPRRPLDVVGHSVGGQFAAFTPTDLPLRRLALLSSSSGYWGRQSAPLKYAAWMFWRVIGPAQLAARGYVPRGLFWKGEPLPAGVWRDWRDFGVNPACFRDRLAELGLDGRYARFTAPIKAWTPDDDPIANPAGVRWLLERYENAPTEMKIIRREDLGRGPIGHDGLFRRKMADVFWPQVFRWLALEDQRAAAE
ncbi:MAG: alpha/beta hydrolase family protein [Oceanicaulis sp.]